MAKSYTPQERILAEKAKKDKRLSRKEQDKLNGRKSVAEKAKAKKATPPPIIETIIFLHGLNKLHTDKSGRNMSSISKQAINDRIANPVTVEKTDCDWVAFTDHKTRDTEDNNGRFHALWVDIDSGNPTLPAVEEIIKPITDDYSIYTTKGATESNIKLRIIVWLKSSLSKGQYVKYQSALQSYLDSKGLITDKCVKTVLQPCYLPNRGAYYDYRISQGNNDNVVNLLSELAAGVVEKPRVVSCYDSTDEPPHIARFNELWSDRVATLLEPHGYTEIGTDFKHDASESGTAGLKQVENGLYYCHSSSDDNLSGQGMGSDNNTFTPYKLFEVLECHGDFTEAMDTLYDDESFLGADWLEANPRKANISYYDTAEKLPNTRGELVELFGPVKTDADIRHESYRAIVKDLHPNDKTAKDYNAVIKEAMLSLRENELEDQHLWGELQMRSGLGQTEFNRIVKQVHIDSRKEAKSLTSTINTGYGSEKITDSQMAGAMKESLKSWNAYSVDHNAWFTSNNNIWKMADDSHMRSCVIGIFNGTNQSYSLKKLNDISSLLKDLMQAKVGTFTNTPMHLLPLQNGVLDCRALVLRPYDINDAFTFQASYKYDAGANCPLFDTFLDKHTDQLGRNHILATMKKTLTGQPLDSFLEISGDGGTGKSTVVNILKKIIGENGIASARLEVLHKDPFSVAPLAGKRIILFNDIAKYVGQTDIIKQLTGRDEINARVMHKQQTLNFVHEGAVIITGNEIISSGDSSNALMRRRKPAIFNTVVVPSETGFQGMSNELSGILNKILNFNADGVLDRICEMPIEYLEEVDSLYKFASEHLISAPGEKVLFGDANETNLTIFQNNTVMGRYISWCNSEGIKTKLNASNFAKRLKSVAKVLKFDYEKKRISITNKQQHYCCGIRLATE